MFTHRLFVVAAVIVAVATSAVQADVFYSGVIDVNAGADGGGVAVLQSNRVGLADGGASFNNVFGTGPGGAAQVGDAIHSVGFAILSGGQVGNAPVPFNSGNNLVAIYALRGRIDNPGPANATANFQVEAGGQGRILIMDRSGAAALSLTEPSTWAKNIADLSNGFLAELGIAEVPTAVGAGEPGPPTTQVPAVVSLANLNKGVIDLDVSFATSTTQFKLDITNLGDFFDNPNVTPPLGDPNNILTSLAALLDLRQQLDSLTQPSLLLDAGDITDLNTIFNQLLGVNFATGLGNAGSDYNPIVPGQPINTGDAALNNVGGFAIPGAQFQGEVIPEPASVLVWSVFGLVGLGFLGVRRRLQRENC